MTAVPASTKETPPVSDAPYTTILHEDPASRKRVRTRLTTETARLPFELCGPIRTFPSYRGRRSHQGKYWFSRSQTYVSFESRFEMTALMMLDFRGDAVAVSSNPFWLLWPKGEPHSRHAPDFFVRRRDGSALVVDVKPADRIRDKDRLLHERTREVCHDLGWEYEEFTEIDSTVERNLRLLCGYHHPRFAPPTVARAEIAECVAQSGRNGVPFGELIDAVSECTQLDDSALICGVYHMVWNGEIRVDLTLPLSWRTATTS